MGHHLDCSQETAVAELWSLSDPQKLEVLVKWSGSTQRSRLLTVKGVEDQYAVPVTLKL
jgi:hypothetical protein